MRLYLGRDPHESTRNYFLHAKCYLFYGGRGGQSGLFDHLHLIVGIVGSSNFTGPGLISDRELNLVHKTVLEESQIDDPEARGAVSHQAIDSSVIEEQEFFLELASSEVLLAELQRVLSTDAQRWLTDLDDGIHSGLERRHTKGMFFYFTAPRDSGRAHF